MPTLSFRAVMLACVAAVAIGFALPQVASLAAQSRSAAVGMVAPDAVAPAVSGAEPLQDAVCGDGRCSPPEDCNTCPRDCGTCCGDRRCAPPEDCNSCPADCGHC
jgi:hypothetical protein